MREDVLRVLKSVRPDIDYENATALVDDNILGSLDIVEIVSLLNDEFVIDISVDDLVPENFNTLDAIVELVESM